MILAFVFSWFLPQSCKSFISNAVYFQDTFDNCATHDEAFAQVITLTKALGDSKYIKTNFAFFFINSSAVLDLS